MDLPFLKANEKLPRGSFFYVQVGDRFYAGEEAETREVEKTDRKPNLIKYDKQGNREGPQRWLAQDGWSWWHRGSMATRSLRDKRKDNLATYRKPLPRKEKEMIKEPTGKLNPKLVDTMDQAKKYRRKDLVQNACDRLKGVYGDLGVQVSVRYEEGDTK